YILWWISHPGPGHCQARSRQRRCAERTGFTMTGAGMTICIQMQPGRDDNCICFTDNCRCFRRYNCRVTEAGINISQLIHDDYFLALKVTFNAGLYVSAMKLLVSCIDS